LRSDEINKKLKALRNLKKSKMRLQKTAIEVGMDTAYGFISRIKLNRILCTSAREALPRTYGLPEQLCKRRGACVVLV